MRIGPFVLAVSVMSVLPGLACNKLEASRARTTARELSSAHLSELRSLATHVLGTCTPAAATVSPAKGTTVDRDPDVVEVWIRCKPKPATYSPMITAAPLRSAKPPNESFFTIGVGKDEDAGMGGSPEELEEYVLVPSNIAMNANDLCIHRELDGIQICVAYRAK